MKLKILKNGRHNMTILTDNKICGHYKYKQASKLFINQCLRAPPGWITLLVGPSGTGKSILLDKAYSQIQNNNSASIADGNIPVIKLKLENTSDGRVKTKWIAIELLKELNHPVFKHYGTIDQAKHYFPSTSKDEATARSSLKECIKQRKTTHCMLDEVHIVTATKNDEYRNSILESIKTALGIDTSLILVGGYSFLYSGIFNSAHFASRCNIIDMGFYRNTEDDLIHWKILSKNFNKYLRLETPDLLIKHAQMTLDMSCGVYGIFEKWLWQCKVYSEQNGVPITLDVIERFAPFDKTIAAIRKDQEIGDEFLKKTIKTYEIQTAEKSVAKSNSIANDKKPTAPRKKPFESNPSRRLPNANEIEIYE